ncbi:MAG: outer membrane beta-barrel protein [Adhaeribacter sp.]
MPGIMMQDGKMQAQGEQVQQILIDGKPFFGKDVAAALQNLPASVIDQIQVYDKKSDKAELSGFDDGERIKTINIVTKPNRKIGRFGKTSAGYGTDGRYLAGASVNLFADERRVTLTGLSNNVNTLNFSADANNAGESQPDNGLITTNALGVNYSETWMKKMEVSGSYFYNQRRSTGSRVRFRDFVLPDDSGQVYNENSRRVTTDGNHNVWLRMDYKINERNRILFTPSILVQQIRSDSYFFGRMENDFGPINQTENTSEGEHFNSDYNSNLLYSHRFLKPGRSVTLRLHNGYHLNTDDNFRLVDNIFYDRADSLENLNQFTRLDRTGLSWEGEVSFTEPVGSKGQLELEYEVGNMSNDSDKRTYDFAEQTDDYSLLNIPLSNTFTNSYLKQEAEAGYRYNTEKLRVQVEGAYQQASLRNEQKFPRAYPLNRDFHSFLPSTRLEYRFSKSRNLQLHYRASTEAPSAGQLQEVIDNSNTLMVRTGNAGLRQAYQHTTRLHYRDHQAETNRSFFAMVGSIFTNNFISNSTFIAPDSLTLPEGITLGKGAQLIRPVNLPGYRNVWTYFSYGQPWQDLSSNININGTAAHSSRPGLINDQLSQTNSSHFRLGLSLSSNISEKIDFTLSTNSSYNLVKNSIRPSLNNNYFSQSTRLRYNWIFWKGLVYRTDLAHQAYAGLSPVGNNYLLWNMSLGKKVFKNQRGELNVNAYDLLKQNTSIWRNVADAYVEDTRNNVLQRYFMLTFTYNIRYFGVGTSEKDFQDKNKS